MLDRITASLPSLAPAEQRVAQLVNAPDGLTPRVVLPIGIPVAEGPRKDRIPFEERAFYDHF